MTLHFDLVEQSLELQFFKNQHYEIQRLEYWNEILWVIFILEVHCSKCLNLETFKVPRVSISMRFGGENGRERRAEPCAAVKFIHPADYLQPSLVYT